MAAAAMLNSGYQAFFNSINTLSSKGATFPPNLVVIGQKLIERHQFFKIQDGGSRHVDFRLSGVFLYIIDVLLFKVATFLSNLVEIGKKMIERHQFSEIQDGGGRHFESTFW